MYTQGSVHGPKWPKNGPKQPKNGPKQSKMARKTIKRGNNRMLPRSGDSEALCVGAVTQNWPKNGEAVVN